ncbi:alkaline phosphatase family protein [Leptothoe spongobia]|uniref:Alkaline phosphatase family protein n=1 Tax=Leptothoe spongobia TAU-MAC 1115 TaxID=1967444 RepID=A0A947DIE3_9CYAN|nr:alkaline phosphatase family protein [Leptothoe spongobia]MBT9317209.1 alkaline phosphatase family protein [Leptothoe spongobia TAU-MAC 1115]
MKKPVIAIGLDATEPALLEGWISTGKLKNLAKLLETGSYQRLQNIGYYRAETPWTTFLTGCTPQTTGYWGPVKYHASTYDVEKVGAYKFEGLSPFYALDDQKVAVFDMPQTTLVDGLNGVQVLAWGAHSPQVARGSQPASLFETLTKQFGEHPAFGRDHANIYSRSSIATLQQRLEIGIDRRGQICSHFLKNDEWDLLLTVFGEAHAAGHYMWHLNESSHPLYPDQVTKGKNSLLSVFQAIDTAIGEIVEAAPKDSTVVVFSAHGMQNNNLDVTSTFFLAELLYRWNFPGKIGFSHNPNQKVQEPIKGMRARRRWYQQIWAQKHDKNPLTRFLRAQMPTKAHRIFDQFRRLLGYKNTSDFVSPYTLQNTGGDFDWQSATWYKPAWSRMKAFALPSFSEGYVRINLKGRDAEGIVEPEDYDAVCDEVIAELKALVDSRSGQPVVQEVIKTRTHAMQSDDGLPDADLVVMWNEEYLTDIIQSPSFGTIGPVPYQRTGSHTPNGFLLINGPDHESKKSSSVASALDLAPTILDLMGVSIPDYFEGNSLVSKAKVTTPV